ncbi:ferroxidase fet3, partial [Cladochytrium tenue]
DSHNPPSTDVYVNWTVGLTTANPDGSFLRHDAIGVNGAWPIAPVYAFEGDTLHLNVTNVLDEPTSIHAHGILQNGTIQYDGVSGVTQCPIPPGSSLVYTYPLRQAGTYWLHGHNLGHYVDGLRAALVVKKRDGEPVHCDDDYVISLSDWYHQKHSTLLAQYLNESNPDGKEPVPDAVLVNESQNSSLVFEPGKTYRLRFVSMSAMGMYTIWIDKHSMTIIEIDGVDVKPHTVKSFVISPAQRYSVLVTAKFSTTDTAYNYQVHSFMDPTMFDPPPTYNTITNLTLIYGKNNPLYPATNLPDHPKTDTELARELSLVKPEKILHPDTSIKLEIDFDVLSDNLNHGTFNNNTYERPYVPSYFTALTIGDEFVSNPIVYGPSTNPSVLDYMKVTEIVLDNKDTGSHPFHIHGHTFQIVEINPDHNYDPSNLTYIHKPIRRDTVTVPTGGYVVLRFVNDNPGVWFLHCHIEWHLQAGLAATLIEAPDRIEVGGARSTAGLDPDLTAQCTSQGLGVSGNAAGNTGTNLTGYVYGPQFVNNGSSPTTTTVTVGAP